MWLPQICSVRCLGHALCLGPCSCMPLLQTVVVTVFGASEGVLLIKPLFAAIAELTLVLQPTF